MPSLRSHTTNSGGTLHAPEQIQDHIDVLTGGLLDLDAGASWPVRFTTSGGLVRRLGRCLADGDDYATDSDPTTLIRLPNEIHTGDSTTWLQAAVALTD